MFHQLLPSKQRLNTHVIFSPYCNKSCFTKFPPFFLPEVGPLKLLSRLDTPVLHPLHPETDSLQTPFCVDLKWMHCVEQIIYQKQSSWISSSVLGLIFLHVENVKYSQFFTYSINAMASEENYYLKL